MLGKGHPLGSQLIDIRRLKLTLPLAAHIAIAQVVGKNENNIWFLDFIRLLFCGARKQGET